jgi:hypothetical protein
MKKERSIQILTFICVMGPFVLFLLKTYNLFVYLLFLPISLYVMYYNYKKLALNKRKSFMVSKVVSLLLIIILIVIYYRQ